MQQEDYFKRQIDQLGKALANVLSKMMDLDSSSKTALKIEMVENLVSEKLNVNMQALIDIDETHFNAYLIHELKVDKNNMESLADILLIYAEASKQRSKLLEKVRNMLVYVQEESTNYSMRLDQKIKNIDQQINPRE